MPHKPLLLPALGYLHQCFAYDSETGRLTWRCRPVTHFSSYADCKRWNAKFAYTTAGYKKSKEQPQWRICVNRVFYQLHRVVWKMMRGEEPPFIIDHINNDASDNRIENLRSATKSQNVANSLLRKSNTSGFKGVQRKGAKYTATIRAGSSTRFIGSFETPNEAHSAYCTAAKEVYGEFWNPG